jgi:uncharacterized membrane protein YphA (DoxX/SURF4 family)
MHSSLPRLSLISAWILAVFFIFGAYTNTFISPEYATLYTVWGYPEWFHYVTAILELITAIFLISEFFRHYGACLAILLMSAALLSALLNGDYSHASAPLVVLILSTATLILAKTRHRITA